MTKNIKQIPKHEIIVKGLMSSTLILLCFFILSMIFNLQPWIIITIIFIIFINLVFGQLAAIYEYGKWHNK